LDGYDQLVTLYQEVTGQDVGHVQVSRRLLQIEIFGIGVLTSCCYRSHLERSRVRQHVADLVCQGDAQVVVLRIFVKVLQGEHCDSVVRRRPLDDAAAVSSPPGGDSEQDQHQHSCNAEFQI